MELQENLRQYKTFSIISFVAFVVIFWLFQPNNNFISWIVVFVEIVLVCFSALLYEKHSEASKFTLSPMLLWHIVWCIPIIVARIYIPIYSELTGFWNKDMIACVSINTLCFYFVFDFFDKVKVNYKPASYKIDIERLARLVVLLLDLSNILFLINVAFKGNFPLLTGNADAVRDAFVSTIFFRIINITRFVYAFVIMCILETSNNRIKKHIYLSVFVNIVFLVLTGYRAYLFQVLMLLLASLKATKKKNRKILVIMACLSIFMFSFVAVVRENGNTNSVGNILQVGIRYIYLYIYPAFGNFQNVMKNISPKGYLFYTLEMFWGIFIDSSKMAGFKNLYYGFGTFNVGTYLLQPYADMGTPGTLIWTSIIAVMASISHKKVRTQPSLTNTVLLGISFEAIFFMHNSFILRSSSEVFYVLIAIILDHIYGYYDD